MEQFVLQKPHQTSITDDRHGTRHQKVKGGRQQGRIRTMFWQKPRRQSKDSNLPAAG